MLTCNGFCWPLQQGYAGIVKLANLLNSETRRKQLHRGAARRKRKMAAYTKTLNDAANFDPEAPKLIVNDLTYIFKGQENSTLAEPMNFEIRGGNVVMIKGGASIGKKNVLRLLARHFIPTTGFVHYPSRWRMRYMDATILFFGGDMNKLTNARFVGGEDGFLKAKAESMGTLEYNLKFGAQFKVISISAMLSPFPFPSKLSSLTNCLSLPAPGPRSVGQRNLRPVRAIGGKQGVDW